MKDDLIYRLRRRAEIRRKIPRSEPDRIAELLEEAAKELERYRPMTQEEYEQDKGA